MYVESIVAKLRVKVDGAGFLQIINDYKNPLNPPMPAEVKQDRKTTQLLPFEEDCVFKENIQKLGYLDSVGRYHWIRKSDIKEIYNEYRKKYLQK
jgi:hypothetical protein